MIGYYLLNNNENTTVAFRQKNRHPIGALVNYCTIEEAMPVYYSERTQHTAQNYTLPRTIHVLLVTGLCLPGFTESKQRQQSAS